MKHQNFKIYKNNLNSTQNYIDYKMDYYIKEIYKMIKKKVMAES